MATSADVRPSVPIAQYVLKVHSRCNVACDYCYMYEHADQSWRGRPVVMSEDTVHRVAVRIAEHAAAHRLATVSVGLHGGEPLLAGRDRLAALARVLRDTLEGVCDVQLWVQTNGVLLDRRFLDLFLEHGIRVGVSLDGDQLANDRHRMYANGRSTYAEVATALGLLKEEPYRRLYGGLLCVIDVANDPIAVYEGLMEFDPPRLDLLLPHATWDNPPVRRVGNDAEYADWLIAIFERWSRDGRSVPIRLFDSIMSTSWGGATESESVGLAQVDLVVVETDGSLELVDSLKAAYEGAPFTGLDIERNSFDEVASHPGVTARQRGVAGLSETCRSCELVDSCGGGLYPHRYRTGSDFDNPSVYCADLKKMISHIRTRIGWKAMPAPAATTSARMSAASFEPLSAGFGDANAVAELAAGQLSLRRALIAAVHRNLGPRSHRSAWGLITELDQGSPDALAEVLAHPYVRVWATESLAASGEDREAVGVPLLASVAGAAAVRAGIRASLRIPVSQGEIVLPTLGVARFGKGIDAVDFACDAGAFSLRAGHAELRVQAMDDASLSADDAVWNPSRLLVVDDLTVRLEDTDPHRDRYDWPAAPRLSDSEVELWRATLTEAWSLIKRDYVAYAAAIATGLSTITPLQIAPQGRDISATLRDAFGGVGIALPETPATLALLLIHEFQHAKLGAVLDMYDLYDRGDPRRYRTAWREDPRPLEGLLQGAYAHVGVTDFWRVRSLRSTGAGRASAAEQFAVWHAGTMDAVGELMASGSLTPAGESFAIGMRSTLEGWGGDLRATADSRRGS